MSNIIGNIRDYNNVWDNPRRYGDTFKDYKKGDKNDNNVEKTSNHGLNNNDIQGDEHHFGHIIINIL